MEIIIHPVYFGNIAHYTAMSQAENVVFEMEDNYQKQTYRNRAYIAVPEGKLLLNIPIKHTSSGQRGERSKVHQKYKEVRIENDFPWQKEHWRSIQIAYRSSPFFEFYEDDIAPLYQKEQKFLMDFNLEGFELINDLLALDIHPARTEVYQKEVSGLRDFRYLAEAKKAVPFSLEPYTQVLEKHHGFLPNLSILDLLFNEGPNAADYLEKQKI